MLLCLRTLVLLCEELGFVMVVAVDKVGGTDERLLGGVDSAEEDCISEKSVRVYMALEEATMEGADRIETLESWLCSVRSVKVDIVEEFDACSPMLDAESSLKLANVPGEAGDGTPYDLCSVLGDFVGVDFATDEL